MVEADVDSFERGCLSHSLVLNCTKCELIISDFDSNNNNQGSLRQFTRISPTSAVLLGVLLSMTDSLLSAINTCIINSRVALDKLQLVARHEALLILRCSLGSPKLMYLLRRTPCHDHPKLEVYDELLLRGGIEQILNISLSDDQWMQASLPIRLGGLGLRRVSSLALFWRLFGFGCGHPLPPVPHLANSLELRGRILRLAADRRNLGLKHYLLPSEIPSLSLKPRQIA